MMRTSLTKIIRGAGVGGRATRQINSQSSSTIWLNKSRQSAITIARPLLDSGMSRSITYTSRVQKDVPAESKNLPAGELDGKTQTQQPAVITPEQYQTLSDKYMDLVLEKLEEVAEEREDVDIEYSAGVLTLTFPPNGQYVINKQPPNKQIWLSSPISGPKRYDFVIVSEGQDSKEDTGQGQWVYLRDGSSLNELLLKEVGVDLSSFSTIELQEDE